MKIISQEENDENSEQEDQVDDNEMLREFFKTNWSGSLSSFVEKYGNGVDPSIFGRWLKGSISNSHTSFFVRKFMKDCENNSTDSDEEEKEVTQQDSDEEQELDNNNKDKQDYVEYQHEHYSQEQEEEDCFKEHEDYNKFEEKQQNDCNHVKLNEKSELPGEQQNKQQEMEVNTVVTPVLMLRPPPFLPNGMQYIYKQKLHK